MDDKKQSTLLRPPLPNAGPDAPAGEEALEQPKESKLAKWMAPGVLAFLAVVTLVCMLLPISRYRYNGYFNDLSALDLLTGRTICGGEVVLKPYFFFFVMAAGVLAVAAAAVMAFLKKPAKRYSLIAAAGGLLVLVSAIVYTVDYNNVLKAARGISVSFGIYILAFCGILVIAFALAIMYRNRMVLLLDFMLIPGLLYLIINNYMPMSGLLLAFNDIDYSLGLFRSPWCGFENFQFLFSSGNAWLITRNTVLYNLAFILLGNLTGLAVGICLSECYSRRMSQTAQTLILLPRLLSPVIISYMAYGFLSGESGWINHFFNVSVSWYSETKYWPFILTFIHIWNGLGYSAVIYLSSIVGVDRNLYEAAYIDGCTKWKTITKITLPVIKPTIIMLVLMAISRIMGSDFGLFYQVPMNSGSLFPVTQTIDTYVYRALMKDSNYSLALAANAYQAVVGFVLILCTNAVIRKVDNSNALF